MHKYKCICYKRSISSCIINSSSSNSNGSNIISNDINISISNDNISSNRSIIYSRLLKKM